MPNLKPRYGQNSMIVKTPGYPGADWGTATAYWVFDIRPFRWLEYMCSWSYNRNSSDIPPLGYFNRKQRGSGSYIDDYFNCLACDKQHMKSSGDRCTCGEPFPYSWRKQQCRLASDAEAHFTTA